MPSTPELNLTDEKICETYPRLVQIEGTKLYDGFGNLIVDLSTLGGSGSIGPAVTGSQTISLTTGTNILLEIDKVDYKGAFVEYVLYDSTNQRSGTLTVTNTGTSLEYTEQSTEDIGNTSAISLDAILNGDNFEVRVLGVPNGNYTIRFIYKYI